MSDAAARSIPPRSPNRIVEEGHHLDPDRPVRILLASATIFSGAVVLLIVFFVVRQAIPVFAHEGLGFLLRSDWDRALEKAWVDPTYWEFGALPVILGTLMTTVGALVTTLALGMGCAVFLAELAPRRLVGPFQSLVRLLSGIPSVVFGLIGLSVFVPLVREMFVSDAMTVKYADVPLDGQSLLVGIIVLTFMILPFFVTVATDSMRSVPESYKLGGLALGMSRWRTITRLVIPPALPGILAGLILAAARAVGEAIALSMVAGSLSNVPSPGHGLVFFLEPVRTMASTIVENGEALAVHSIESAMFGLGTLLLFSSLALSLAARLAFAWFQKRMGMTGGIR